jgi:hypothetical protein
MAQTVGLGMIVRDAAATLARCLDSVGAAVDEIVIVDTGSIDDTREIAARFTSRLHAFAWCDDFAAARQAAFDRVTTDWVCWLDADDRVEGAGAIRGVADECATDVGELHWKYVYAVDRDGNSCCEYWRERCVRNDGSYRWKGRVHEVLVSDAPRRKVYSPTPVVHHERDPRERRDPRRNLRILEDELERVGTAADPRLLYYLGAEHAATGDPVLAIAFLQRFLRASTSADEKYLAELELARLFRDRGAFPESLRAARAALRRAPEWAAACFSLARTYACTQQWEHVIFWCERGLALPPPSTGCVVNPMEWRFNWIVHYVYALVHCGRRQEALDWTRHALQISPRDPWHLANLRLLDEAMKRTVSNG